MKGKYTENKKAIMAWRSNNKEKYKEYQKEYQRELYHKNKEQNNQARLKRYYWNKIATVFRNILID